MISLKSPAEAVFLFFFLCNLEDPSYRISRICLSPVGCILAISLMTRASIKMLILKRKIWIEFCNEVWLLHTVIHNNVKRKHLFKCKTYNFNNNDKCDKCPDQIVIWGHQAAKGEKWGKKDEKRKIRSHNIPDQLCMLLSKVTFVQWKKL